MAKNDLAWNFCKMTDPSKHPAVRNMKYKLVANDASLSPHPRRSINILGAVVLVPTSMPTWHMMPKNDKNMNGLPSKLRHSPKVEALPCAGSSCTDVPPSQKIAIIAITM